MKSSVIRLLCLFVLACSLSACGGGGPETFAEHFYETVAEGETEQAVELFSAQDMQAVGMIDMRSKVTMLVGQMRSRIDGAGGLESVEVVNVNEIGDNRATVDVILHLGDGSTLSEQLKLVREDDQWRVDLR